MRFAVLFAVLTIAGTSRAQTSAPDEKGEPERARKAAHLALRAAETYAITLEGEPSAPLRLVPKPLLQWSNPVAGSIYGSVFVWTDQGRPAVVASIYKWYAPNDHLGVEFHSLVSGPVSSRRVGSTVWASRRAGLEFRPVPGAPSPADKPVGRLSQMRALAKEFTASETTRENVSRELRLLPNPVFRNERSDDECLDGGLFAFVEGTDPEVFLVVQARRSSDGARCEWAYALARMNSCAVKVSRRGREVWSLPEITWAEAFDHSRPYTLFTFKPGDGVNPPGPDDGVSTP